MAVIATSLNEKSGINHVREMPFKYREKRNAYFKEYMRKWRAEKRSQQAIEEEGSSVPSHSGFEQREEHLKHSEEVLHYEILAA